jgi:hypothetical protein
LAVQDGREFAVWQHAQFRAMVGIPLVIVLNKSVKLELHALFGFDFPKQEGSERIALHQAVKQTADLIRLPDELALDSRKNIQIPADSFECLSDG